MEQSDWLLAGIKAFLPHFLALGIAIGAGWYLYHRQQAHRRDRLIASLFFESALNLSILKGVVIEKKWRSNSIDPHFPTTVVGPAISGEPSFFNPEQSRSLLLAIMFYRLEVDAARWTMKLMFERISKESELSERDLETLYRICKSAIAATEALQTHLNAYSIVHNIRVGTHDEGMQFGREFREHYEKIQSEMR